MADVEIKGKPDKKPTISAPKRASGGSRSFTVKWSPGTWFKSGKNERRCEGWQIELVVYCQSHKNPKTKKKLTYKATTTNVNKTDWTLNLNNFKCGKTTYTRNSFYPNTDWCVRSLKAVVRGKNRKGLGPAASATTKFEQPRKPSISMEQDKDTGDVKFKVKHDKGTDSHEVWNTRVWYEVWDSSKAKGHERIESDTKYFGTNEAEHTYSCDVYGRMGKAYDQYTRVTVKARTRGLWGESSEVTKKLLVSWPNNPSVEIGTVDKSDPRNKITVWVNTNESTNHPVTGVRLEKLVNVDYRYASQIPGDADWQQCGAVDDGKCTALSSTVSELLPDPGKYTYVRVKTWNQIEAIFYRHSWPQRLRDLESESPVGDDTVKIVDAWPGDDGESVAVLIAWNNDDSDGTEVSHSSFVNAWRSDRDPRKKEVTYDDGPYVEGEGQTAVRWGHSALVYLTEGIERGVAEYIRARRYMETDDGKEYGVYFPTEGYVSVVPTNSPTSATLIAPASVPRGQSLALSWTFDGGGEQSAWELYAGPATIVEEEVETQPDPESEPVVVTVERLVLEGDMLVVAHGDDATGACFVPFERVESVLAAADYHTGDPVAAFAVSVSTGGTAVMSDAIGVRVADPPVASVTAATVTSQPLEFDVACTSEASLSVIVTSAGSSWDTPAGTRVQAEGEQVWAQQLTPVWTGTQGEWEATVTAPEGLPLADVSAYRIRVVATDDKTGLKSEPATCEVDVDYARKAPEPAETIAVTPYDTTDADSGFRTRGCAIVMDDPDGAVATDVYDLYRVTPDGVDLVAEGLLTAAVVDDPYAPFGDDAELAYRVSCRTVDGVEQWLDYPYALGGEDLRIDYEGPHGMDYVELPYNLVVSDSGSKDFETRAHLDGSVAGYYSPVSENSSTLAADLTRDHDQDRQRRVRELKESVSGSWVRTPIGQAYEANVNVSSIGTLDYRSAAVPIALDVTGFDRVSYGVTVAPTSEDGETEPDEEPEQTEEV